LAGRWISLVFLIMGTGLSALAAIRVSGRIGAAAVLFLLGLHPLVVATGVWTKPYALATMLLAAGLFLVAGHTVPKTRIAIGTGIIALAVGTRLSLLPVLLAALVLLPQRGVALLGALVGLALAFSTVAQVPIDVLGFHWLGFHLNNHLGGLDSAWFLERLGFVWNAGWVFAPIWFLLFRHKFRPRAQAQPVVGVAFWGLVGVVLLHLLPRALHIEHIVIATPLLGILLAAAVSALPRRRLVLVGLAMGAIGCSLWSLRWVQLDGGARLAETATLGTWIGEHTPPESTILTLDTALAVESARRVPRGFEMGRFSWNPELFHADVLRQGLLDAEQVRAALALGPAAIAVQDGDFGEGSPLNGEVQAAMDDMPAQRTAPGFGPHTLHLGAIASSTVWVPMDVQ
jgi:hypothetical protein